MSNRLFRLADFLQYKHNIVITADETAPAQIPMPSELLEKQRIKLKELYTNFFSNQADMAMSGSIPMHALFEFKEVNEPQIKGLFKLMEQLMSKVDSLDVVKLFRAVSKILAYCESIEIRELEKFLEGFRVVHRGVDIRTRQQFIIGFKNRIKSISRRLVEVRNVLAKFVPEKEAKKSTEEMIEYPATILHESLIRRFLLSPAADKYRLSFDNWEMMFSDPTLNARLAKLLHKWEANNFVLDVKLSLDLDAIVKEFEQRKESNIPYLEQGEAFAPSTSTSVQPERASLFEPKTGPSQFQRIKTDPELDARIKEQKRREQAEEDGGGVGEGSF